MVRTYLSRLRRSLEIDLVTRVPGGYRCLVRAEQVDLHRLDSLLTQARRARADGDTQARSAALGAALELFGGEPLAGVPGPFAEGQRQRLHEVRWSAVEERIAFVMSGGTEGVLSPHLTVFTRRPVANSRA